jgi:branched-chain amino acid transport system ATP-binding protein
VPGAILRLEGLSKSFGALQVTKDVSLDVQPFEVHAVIGPNGAGKSTLIAQIAGSLRRGRGRILFAGRDITHLTVPARASLGLARIFQTTSLIGSFTAWENVALAAQAKAGSSFSFWRPASDSNLIRAQAFAALERVRLQERASERAAALSHGDKRALELAIGLVQHPSLFLLDEPMAGVGREETRTLTALLASLKGQAAMLLVEHDMSAVFALADRITVLANGAVIATGTPAEIKDNPDVRKAYLGEDSL